MFYRDKVSFLRLYISAYTSVLPTVVYVTSLLLMGAFPVPFKLTLHKLIDHPPLFGQTGKAADRFGPRCSNCPAKGAS